MKPNKYIESLFRGARGSTFKNAKFLRKNETEAEKLLWNELRDNKLQCYKFRRQHPISKFVADFYCAKKKIVIELDGSVHNWADSCNYDRIRTELLNDVLITVIRFKNFEVEKDIKKVLKEIVRVLESK